MNAFPTRLLESINAGRRAQLGIDKMSGEELFEMVFSVLLILPKDVLGAHLVKLRASSKARDRLQAKQLGILLFAIAEINSAFKTITPEEAREILTQALSEKEAPRV